MSRYRVETHECPARYGYVVHEKLDDGTETEVTQECDYDDEDAAREDGQRYINDMEELES
jgi:hypothetical protein